MDKQHSRRFLGIPYDWQAPTWSRVKARAWNPQDRRILTPKVFGWGFTVNWYEVARRLRLIRRP